MVVRYWLLLIQILLISFVVFQTGDLTFEVVFVSPEDSDEEEEHGNVNYYDSDKDRYEENFKQ